MSSYFTTYKAEVLRNLGRDDTQTELMVIESFNDVQKLVAKSSEWDCLMTTVTVDFEEGTYEYEYSTLDITDIRKFYSIKINDGTRYFPPLQFILQSKWDQEFASRIHATSSRPTFYTTFSNVLCLSTKPNQDYTADIRFLFNPADVTGDLSEVDLTDCDSVLKAMTTAMVWLKLEELDKAKSWFTMAGSLLKSHNMDLRDMINFKALSQTSARATGNYWADPFVRSGR